MCMQRKGAKITFTESPRMPAKVNNGMGRSKLSHCRLGLVR
jgi:hypothetical protein